MTPEIQKEIERIVATTDEYCDSHPLFYLGKCMEELGEFAEAFLVEQGFMPRKVLKEDSFGEAADVINCVISALRVNQSDMSQEEFATRLGTAMISKNDKFVSIYDGTYDEKYGNK